MSLNMETFEIGNDLYDIGGDEIDLSQISVTDTLIGKTQAELTAALGEPSLNEFEKYHLGDAGISDINIGTFDSALLMESGIKPYTAGEEINDDAKQLASSIGEQINPKKAEDIVADALSSVFKNADKEAKRLLDSLTLEDFDYEDDFIDEAGNLISDDDDEFITTAMSDDDSDDWSLEEIEELQKAYESGNYDKFN